MKPFFYILPLLFISKLGLAQNVQITPSGITPGLSGSYPRLTYDAIEALPSPVKGDMVYDTTFECIRTYNGNKWLSTSNTKAGTPYEAIVNTTFGTNSASISDIVAVGTNVYAVGSFQGDAQIFGQNHIQVNNLAFPEIFVAKLNINAQIIWIQKINHAGHLTNLRIAVDASSNVYFSGSYTGSITFGSTTISSTVNGYDIILGKYNSNGTPAWVKTAGGTSSDYAYGLCVDSIGNVFICGSFSGTAFWDSISRASAGNSDIYLAKYNSSGAPQYVVSHGGTSVDRATDCKTDTSNNVYLTGVFSNTVSFSGINRTSAANTDIFVNKYNGSTAALTWNKWISNTSSSNSSKLAINNSGFLSICGSFLGTINFDATLSYGGYYVPSNGGNDIFLALLSTSDGYIETYYTGGGPFADDVIGLTMGNNTDVYFISHFQAEYKDAFNQQLLSSGFNDVIVGKIAFFKTNSWVKNLGGMSNEYSGSISRNDSGDIFFVENILGATFLGNTSHDPVNSSSFSSVLGRLDRNY